MYIVIYSVHQCDMHGSTILTRQFIVKLPSIYWHLLYMCVLLDISRYKHYHVPMVHISPGTYVSEHFWVCISPGTYVSGHFWVCISPGTYVSGHFWVGISPGTYVSGVYISPGILMDISGYIYHQVSISGYIYHQVS